ncbi:MAG: hypothetical protein JSR91_10425 [Proteobacteria bacterium]|nr:hypothetical protein [Pseudomonadota bacterium]
MGKMSGLIAVAFLLSTTGCVEAMNSGYPATSYGYGYGAPAYYGNTYSRSYSSNGYYSQPSSYYRPYPVTNNYYTVYRPAPPAVVTRTRYVPVPVPAAAPPRHHHHNRDWNGDGIPDRWQRRP